MSKRLEDERSDVVIRCHSPSRFNELERAVFSVVAQTAQPITAIVVTQRFGDDALAETWRRLKPLFSAVPSAQLDIHDWREKEPADGRSHLINEGIRRAKGRYLSFLDYDDVLFPEAHRILRGRLKDSGAAIAFASVQTMWVDVFDSFVLTKERAPAPFNGSTLLDLFHDNFAPVHSYLIDRHRAPAEELRFDEALTWEEDYEFLLRLCARAPSDLSKIGTPIGWYNFKTDGSNSVPTTVEAAFVRGEEQRRVRREIARRKSAMILTPEIAAQARRAGNVSGSGSMTVADAAALKGACTNLQAPRSPVLKLARALFRRGRDAAALAQRRS